MRPLVWAALAATTLCASASAGEIRCTLIGSIDSNSYTSGPFGGHAIGDTVTLTFVVDTPGTDVAPGQLVNYNIQLATFDLEINGPTGAMLAGPTNLQVQNDFPAADGFRINQTNLASGHFFSAGFGATGAMFSSVDIEQLAGTYQTAMFLTSFSYSIFGQGGMLEVFPETLIIDPPAVGTPFCDPMNVNSTGASTTLSGTPIAGGSGLHLEATQGPPTEFGYFLVGTGVDDPGITISQGRLCLSGTGGNFFGRYNVSGGALNSVGQFDAAGVMQNQVGTSAVGSGYDVPLELPFAGSPTILAGDTWHFQLWHREAAGESNFSNGLSVTF